MAVRRPLVLDGGVVRQLPTGDTLPTSIAPVVTLDASAATVNVDFSLGSVFAIEAAKDTHSLVFQNPSEGQVIHLAITGKNIGSPYDLTALSYTGNQFEPAQAADPQSFRFNAQGTKLYVPYYFDANYVKIAEFDIDPAWSLASPVYVALHTIGGYGLGSGIYMTFAKDGDYLYVQRDNTRAARFTLDPAYDDMASEAGQVLYTNPYMNSSNGFRLSPDGTRFYYVKSGSIHQCPLATPYNLDSLTADTTVYLSEEGSVRGFDFNGDGSKLFVWGYQYDAFKRYSLSTPWDITTRSYDSISASTSSPGIYSAYDMAFGKNGEKLYLCAYNAGIAEYDCFGSPAPAVFVYPTSVEWPGGAQPSTPSDGETDLIRITCLDATLPRYLAEQVGDAYT
jgi:hypothetical protein